MIGEGLIPSGLWHHRQRRGQPLRNTVVRIPGPSWIEKRWISKTRPDRLAIDPCIFKHSFSLRIFWHAFPTCGGLNGRRKYQCSQRIRSTTNCRISGERLAK